MAQATARLLLGGPLAQAVLATVTAEAAEYREAYGHAPALAVVVCGHEAPSMVYLRQILRGCEKVGLEGRLVEIEGDDPEGGLINALRGLGEDPEVAGIIVQMPLPDTVRLRPVVEAIDPAKDIDGIHPLNAGLVRLGYDGFVPATVTVVESLGHERNIACRLDDGTLVITRQEMDDPRPTVGEALRLTTAPEFLHLFDADTGERVDAA